MCLLQPLLLKWVDSKDVHTIDHHGAPKTIKAQEEETGHTGGKKLRGWHIFCTTSFFWIMFKENEGMQDTSIGLSK